MRDNYATVTGSSTVTIKANDGVPKSNSIPNSGNQNSNQNSSQSNGGMDGNADAGISRVQTGDESNIFFYAVMLAASAFGLTRLKRKEKRKS